MISAHGNGVPLARARPLAPLSSLSPQLARLLKTRPGLDCCGHLREVRLHVREGLRVAGSHALNVVRLGRVHILDDGLA